MTKKSDAPAIRFKGFSDAWEQRKLSEITVVEPQVQEIRAIGTVILIGMHLLKLRIKSMQIRVRKR